MHEFHTQRRIEFADTDLGGMVHFSRFFVFMETAEHELLHSLGATPHGSLEGRSLGWPRVSASCDYRLPARYGDVLDITVRVLRKGKTSLTYGFRFRRGDVLIAEGRMTSVCCEVGDDGWRPVTIPAAVADGIEEARGS